MKPLLILAAIFLLPLPARSQAVPDDLIQIEKADDWGGSSYDEMMDIFRNVADILWAHRSPIRPILIYRSANTPITDYLRDGRTGRVRIGLTSTGAHWAQLVYQFSHEFCHAMARFSQVSGMGRETIREQNMWFEEALCESASLFMLRRMTDIWTNDGNPDHRRYAHFFADYALSRMTEQTTLIPASQSFIEWFFDKQAKLRANPGLRDYDTIVAKQLLPLFEANPGGWEAICYLNKGAYLPRKPFQDFLRDWGKNCPADLRSFVSEIEATFYQ